MEEWKRRKNERAKKIHASFWDWIAAIASKDDDIESSDGMATSAKIFVSTLLFCVFCATVIAIILWVTFWYWLGGLVGLQWLGLFIAVMAFPAAHAAYLYHRYRRSVVKLMVDEIDDND